MTDSIHIALMGNSTTEYLGKAIQKECEKYFIPVEIYNAPFGQYSQEILYTGSGFYLSKPDITFIHLEGRLLFPEWYSFDTLQEEMSKKESLVEEVFHALVHLMEKIHANSTTKIILNSFTIPYHSPLGILDNRNSLGLKQMIQALNRKLEAAASSTDYLYIFDYNGLCSYEGQNKAVDRKMYYLAKNAQSFSFIKKLSREYLRYILPLKSMNKKCLVLDLDNTLWGGIAGEDGINGIQLDITGPGKSFYDFQKEILSLYKKGIILAINSKNNWEDAMNIIDQHPYMLLKSNYFSCLKINWQDKVENLKEIAQELNIGLDSMVFFDDNPVEREYVKSSLPLVAVVEVPEDKSRYADILHGIVEFESLRITEEDRKRNKMYEENRKRLEASHQFMNKKDYLASLQTKVVVASANEFTLPRIAQLTQKTNQFNMTTKRYQPADIEHMLSSKKYLVFSCSVSDKFGDSGLVGCCIVNVENKEPYIDSFLLSCRVLGRNVEFAFLSSIVGILREKGYKSLLAQYIKTEKNRANEDFYSKAGFTLKEYTETAAWYILQEKDKLSYFEAVTVISHEGGDYQWTKNS